MLLLLPVAFFSGLLTALSPCVLPILPIVLGSGIDGKKQRTNGIIAGLVISFSAFTLFFAFVVSSLGVAADTIRNVAVGVLIAFGITLLFPEYWDKISGRLETYLPKPRGKSLTKNDFNGGFLTGIMLGAVWTPCIGPIIATVVTLAAVNEFSVFTIVLVLSFSVGIGIPLWFIARGGSRISSKLEIFKRKGTQIRKVFGMIVVFTGIMIGLGIERKIQTWFIENLPESWTQIATTVEDNFEIEKDLEGL